MGDAGDARGDGPPKLNRIAAQTAFSPPGSVTPRTQSAVKAQWSPDGTCIIRTSADSSVDTIVVPDDLLNGQEHELNSYSRIQAEGPIYATAVYPHFALDNASTTLVLSATRDKPMQLRNALNYEEGVYATYPWVDQYTEAHVCPHSLAFTADAQHFIAGSKAQFAIYDVNRPQNEALHVKRTSRKRKAVKQFGIDPKCNATRPNAYITAMDISCEDTLALGTTTREIALYSDHGLGHEISAFKLPPPDSGSSLTTAGGITQVKWSSCGTYLLVAERWSDTIELFDVRRHSQRLSWMTGRKANVAFQTSFDIVPTMSGYEVWAGGTDGHVRMWSAPEQREGQVEWTEEWKVHDDSVCATMVHSSGSVVATLAAKDRYSCQQTERSDEDGETTESSTSSESSSEGSDSDQESEARSEDTSNGAASTVSDPLLKIWSLQ